MVVRPAEIGRIRAFVPDDLGEITELSNSCLTEYYTQDIIYDIYRAWPEGIFVYTVGRGIKGFIAGARYTRTEGRILLLAVEREYRNMGIGTALMDHFLDVCRENSLLSIRLEVRTDNNEAIRFYRRYGFSVTHTMPAYYSDLSDALLMWRML